MKIILTIIFSLSVFVFPVREIFANDLSKNLLGKIFLQVESHGEAWYINPLDLKRYYLGRPSDALTLMRELGLGVSNADFDSFRGVAPARLAGRILLKVEDSGQAYYADPSDKKLHFLGRPHDAFDLMRQKGIGISNKNLEKIQVSERGTQNISEVKSETLDPVSKVISDLEKYTHKEINKYRQSVGLEILEWNDEVASVAREHSRQMSIGEVEFGHDGGDKRFAELIEKTGARGMGENVAYNFGYDDPVMTAVEGWLDSPGHKENIDGDFDYTGIGIVKNEKGYYYLTQLFAR